MRFALSVAALGSALFTSAAFLVGGSGCGSFGEASPPSAGGAEPPRPRDVRVEASWPAVADLDPGADVRLASIRVVLTDATDTTRTVQTSFPGSKRGPYDFPQFNTTNLVDATIELTEDSGRVLGYGARRRWNLGTNATVAVAPRKRILYITSDDRSDGELRTFDLAPPMLAEPAMKERASSLPSLSLPSALFITADGLLLVQAGQARQAGAGGAPLLDVFATGTHALEKTIPLKYPLSAAIPLGEGHEVLVAPVKAASVATFSIVDLDTGSVRALPTGRQGGGIHVWSIAASPDGSRVAAVGTYSDGMTDQPFAFTHVVGSDTVTSTPLSELLEVARGVRFTPDGKLIVVAGASKTNDWSTGALLFFDAASPSLTAPKAKISMEVGVSRASSLFLGPSGKFAYVGNETEYTGNSQSCCGDLRVFDLVAMQQVAVVPYGASGPELELSDTIRLPYGSHRVIAGQTDNGNNVHGAFVELLPDTPIPVAIPYVADGDVGSLTAMATPFGARY